MGTISFHLPDPLPAEAEAGLARACLVGGYDLTPVPSHRTRQNGQLALTKDANESGYVSLPWPVAGAGDLVCQSSTLRERTEPYHLLLELARGKLNQVRTQAAEWESIGLVLDPPDRAEMSEATRQFGRSLFATAADESARLAGDVLARAHRLGGRLARSFTEQLAATRQQESGGPLPTRLGCRLSRVPPPSEEGLVRGAFSAVRLVPEWRAIEPTESAYDWTGFDALVEWSLAAGFDVSVGPLIDLGGPLPDWLGQWAGDLPSLAAFTCDFAETVIRRYQDRVAVWQVFAGFNHRELLGLGEDDRLRLAARLLESARQTFPDGQWVAGLAQPWGDYLASEEYTYSPLVFADTLMRAGYALAAVELELLIGDEPRGSRSRDALDVYRVLELFGVLGVPLQPTFGTALGANSPTPDGWAETVVGLASALPTVSTVFWDAWAEGPPGRVPGVALSTRAGVSPLVEAFRGLRERALA